MGRPYCVSIETWHVIKGHDYECQLASVLISVVFHMFFISAWPAEWDEAYCSVPFLLPAHEAGSCKI